MKREQAEILEKEHNVYIDENTEMFTTGNPDDDYGWQPIPDHWMDEIN